MTAANDLHLPPAPGATIIVGPDREGREFVDADGLTIYLVTFIGGKTNLRFNRCKNIRVIRCPKFCGVTGNNDLHGDGQNIQIINPQGPHSIEHCTFVASEFSEDLVSVFADEPCPASAIITIIGCNWTGRGKSESSTSLCADGKFCPPVHVSGGTISAARCAITLASGTGHRIDRVAMPGCQTKIYVASIYGTPVRATLIGYRPDDVLIGDGVRRSDVLLMAA